MESEQDIAVEGFKSQMEGRGWAWEELPGIPVVVIIRREGEELRFEAPLRRKAFYEACSHTKHVPGGPLPRKVD